MNASLPHRSAVLLSPRRQYAAVAAVCCFGVVCSVASLLAIRSWERKRVADDFDHASADRASSVKGVLDVHNLIASSLQAFLLQSTKVTPREFHDFTTPLLRQEPSIQALEWIPRVQQSDRAAFEANARVAIRPDFHFTQRSERGLQVRSECQEYFPVYCVEPYLGNEPALGFDLGSQPTRREALERARDTGQAAATAPIILVQEKGNEPGYLVFLPVYEGAAPPSPSRAEGQP